MVHWARSLHQFDITSSVYNPISVLFSFTDKSLLKSIQTVNKMNLQIQIDISSFLRFNVIGIRY